MADLSPAQLRVVRLLADGRSYESIGRELWLSPWTVRNHAKAARAVAKVDDRDALVAWAEAHGLLEGGDAA